MNPYVALIPVCIGIFITADDQTVVVTVLPEIIRSMEISPAELDHSAWTITGYLLGYLCAMPLSGNLSDIFGRRRLFIISMSIFMLGSIFVGLTNTMGWLIAARIFQAVGAGALVPISISIVGDLFKSGRRALAFGLVGASAEAGGVIGPLWGGIIVNILNWRWVFWINLPLSIFVIALVLLMLSPSHKTQARIDYAGSSLIIISLVFLTLGLSRIDLFDLIMVGCFTVSFISLTLLIIWHRSKPNLLIPKPLLRTPAFWGANIAHIFIGASLIIGMITVPLMANTVMGLTSLEGGLWLVRMTAAIPIGAVLGGLACQRIDSRIPSVLGLLFIAIGFFLMSTWSTSANSLSVTINLVVSGLGFGLLIAPISIAAIEHVNENLRGTAAGVVSASRIIGMTLGTAAVTAWGSKRFIDISPTYEWPFQLNDETILEFNARMNQYQAKIIEAGTSVFNEFFLIAVATSVIALIPVLFLTYNRR